MDAIISSCEDDFKNFLNNSMISTLTLAKTALLPKFGPI